MADKKTVTFICDLDVLNAIQTEADKYYEGKFSMAIRAILNVWHHDNPDK